MQLAGTRQDKEDGARGSSQVPRRKRSFLRTKACLAGCVQEQEMKKNEKAREEISCWRRSWKEKEGEEGRRNGAGLGEAARGN